MPDLISKATGKKRAHYSEYFNCVAFEKDDSGICRILFLRGAEIVDGLLFYSYYIKPGYSLEDFMKDFGLMIDRNYE